LTLKEEIHKVISDHFYDIVPVDDCTNDILKLFEKEIDSMILELTREWKEPAKVPMVAWADMYATMISTFFEFKEKISK
jgi:hypothetical protein